MVAPKSARMSRLRACMTRPAHALAALMVLPTAADVIKVATSCRGASFGTFRGAQRKKGPNSSFLPIWGRRNSKKMTKSFVSLTAGSCSNRLQTAFLHYCHSALLFVIMVTSTLSVSISSASAQSCSGAVELWFLNDESTSVSSTEFSQSKDFLASVSQNFTFDASSGMRGALVAWGTAPRYVSGLTGSFPSVTSSYTRATSGTQYTYPGLAMSYAKDAITDYNNSQYKTDGGAAVRGSIPSVVVMLTDADGINGNGGGVGGLYGASEFESSAAAIRAAGNQIVLMVIGEAADRYAGSDVPFQTLLNSVAGGAQNVMVGATYADIANPTNGYISGLTTKICSAVAAVAPSGSPAIESGEDRVLERQHHHLHLYGDEHR